MFPYHIRYRYLRNLQLISHVVSVTKESITYAVSCKGLMVRQYTNTNIPTIERHLLPHFLNGDGLDGLSPGDFKVGDFKLGDTGCRAPSSEKGG